jgi:hypothetical protein
MEIKIQCDCGARFVFEVEPVNGLMPCAIACPECGVDRTESANHCINQNLAGAASAAAPESAPAGGLRISRAHHAPASSAATAPVTADVQFCSKHHRQQTEAKCFVCGQPICRVCMSVFGFLCSAGCRFKAEQEKIAVPVCEHQKSVIEAKGWGKAGRIAGAIGTLVAGVLGFYAWYIFVGVHPRLEHTWKAGKGTEIEHARFLSPSQVLLVNGRQIILRDLQAQKEIWTKSIPKEDGGGFSFANTQLHLTPDHIWLGLANSILRLDRKTGETLTTVRLPGRLERFNVEATALVVSSLPSANQEAITRIDLAAGTAKTETISLAPVQKVTAKNEAGAATPATAGALAQAELDEEVHFDQSRSQVFASGKETAELQVKLLETRLVEVASIKPEGKTLIDEKLSVSTSATSVAEEVFNDIKRSRGGGTKKLDESRYAVTLRRPSSSASPWRGEVIGPPLFFMQKTVDVLCAGTRILFFDKANKKLAEGKMPYSVSDIGARFGRSRAAALEQDNVLYFADQGGLTAYELPSGKPGWRIESVGVTSVQSDGDDCLYVCTTTATAADIQYSSQIKLGNKTEPALLKVDAKSGKLKWMVGKTGTACFMVGKQLYTCNQWVSGPGLVTGLSEALGGGGASSGRFILSRINPSNGKEIWYYNQSGEPNAVDFEDGRILLVFDDRVEVLKFFSF